MESGGLGRNLKIACSPRQLSFSPIRPILGYTLGYTKPAIGKPKSAASHHRQIGLPNGHYPRCARLRQAIPTNADSSTWTGWDRDGLDAQRKSRYIIRNSTNYDMNARLNSPADVCTTDRCAPGTQPDSLDAEELAVLMKALAHPVRIQLLRHLASAGECFFGDLSEITGLAASTTSQHVKVLREAGLINGSSQEQRVCYCVNKDRLSLLKRLVKSL
jgi:ArsR family transcriptional regulator, arsenate/arsenite/antimonite-responsive transcriptional repressor